MMNYVSRILLKEHENVLLGLDILEAMIGRICDNENIDSGDVYDMIQFLNTYVDSYHHDKEERLYYPVLTRATMPVRDGAMKQIMKEHALSRRYFSDLQEAAQDPTPRTDVIVAAATVYIDLMRRHIERENNMLFPLGDQAIPKKEQLVLSQQFVDYEQNEMNISTKEMMYLMLSTFEEKYLVSAV